MFCPGCGLQVNDDLKFCRQCGANLHSVREAMASRSTREKFDWSKTWWAEMIYSRKNWSGGAASLRKRNGSRRKRSGSMRSRAASSPVCRRRRNDLFLFLLRRCCEAKIRRRGGDRPQAVDVGNNPDPDRGRTPHQRFFHQPASREAQRTTGANGAARRPSRQPRSRRAAGQNNRSTDS